MSQKTPKKNSTLLCTYKDCELAQQEDGEYCNAHCFRDYNVCVTEKNYGSVNVVAQSIEDAKIKALEACEKGMADFSNGEYEIGSAMIDKFTSLN